MLRNFNLLNNLTKRGTISSSVFTADTDLLSSLTLQHCKLKVPRKEWDRLIVHFFTDEPSRTISFYNATLTILIKYS